MRYIGRQPLAQPAACGMVVHTHVTQPYRKGETQVPTTTAASPDPLPPLDPADDKLLTIYLTEVNTHLPAFANKSGLTFTNAIAFLARPDIARYIAYFHKLRESTQRMIALNYLRELVEVSEDPIEQRRAATTLLRALRLPPLPVGGGGGWAPSAQPTSKPPTTSPTPTPVPSSSHHSSLTPSSPDPSSTPHSPVPSISSPPSSAFPPSSSPPCPSASSAVHPSSSSPRPSAPLRSSAIGPSTSLPRSLARSPLSSPPSPATGPSTHCRPRPRPPPARQSTTAPAAPRAAASARASPTPPRDTQAGCSTPPPPCA